MRIHKEQTKELQFKFYIICTQKNEKVASFIACHIVVMLYYSIKLFIKAGIFFFFLSGKKHNSLRGFIKTVLYCMYLMSSIHAEHTNAEDLDPGSY